MPAPGSATWDDQVKVDAHTAVRDYIDQGTGAGVLKLYTEADVELVSYTLSDPCGTVNGTTGQLTITAPASANATATGTCTWCRVTDSDANRAFDLPVQTGTSPVSGYLVLNTDAITTGSPVAILSITIG